MVTGTVLKNRLSKAGRGKDVKTTYNYANGSFNANGLGNEGFEIFTSKNVETGARVEEHYNQHSPNTAMPKKRRVLDKSRELTREEFTYAKLGGEGGIGCGDFKDNINEQRIKKVLTYKGGRLVSKKESFYDENGLNNINLEHTTQAGGGPSNLRTCRSFLVNRSNWLIEYVTEERQSGEASGNCGLGGDMRVGVDFSLTRMFYSSKGDLTKKSVAIGGGKWRDTHFEYDERGALVSQENALGMKTTYRHDGGHMYVTETTNPRGDRTFKEYNKHGQIIEKTLPNGAVHYFEYDGFARQTKIYGPHPETNKKTLFRS